MLKQLFLNPIGTDRKFYEQSRWTDLWIMFCIVSPDSNVPVQQNSIFNILSTSKTAFFAVIFLSSLSFFHISLTIFRAGSSAKRPSLIKITFFHADDNYKHYEAELWQYLEFLRKKCQSKIHNVVAISVQMD